MLIFDIETDGLYHQATKIHVIAIYNTDTRKLYSFSGSKVIKGLKMLENQKIIGHNIIKFDIPVIQKLYPWFKYKSAIDTQVLASLAFPDIGRKDDILIKKGVMPRRLRGKQSLEAWGIRLGVLKGDFGKQNQWHTLTKEMIEYCKQDVRVTVALWNKLKTQHYSQESIKLEHQVAYITGRVERYGFWFDVQKAWELADKLEEEMKEIERQLQEVFPPKKIITGYYKRPNSKKGIKAGDPKYVIKPFNPGSMQQIIERLTEKYGFCPTTKTDKGKDTIKDEDLERWDIPEAPLLLRYKGLKKLLGMVKTGDSAWLKVFDPKTHRIYHSIMSNGAVTGRMRHFAPNIAQVPKLPEYRELFQASPGKVLVGVDASALEFRCFANRVGDEDYIKVVLEKDIHTENQKLAGLPTRSAAKTFIYAFLYGGGDEKLGTIVAPKEFNSKKLIKLGKELREKFLNAVPGLLELQKRVKYQYEQLKYIVGLDGRPLRVRKLYSALNTLLQSDGAIVMKRALVIADRDLQKKGYVPGRDYEFVALVHDEFQVETLPEYAEDIGNILRDSIRKAGEWYNFKCPLDGEVKIGKTWAETH